MAKKVATLLKKLLNDAGIKDTDPKMAEVLTITADIDDSLFDAIENNPNLITIENAKNHVDLKSHFNAQIFNGLDAKILAVAKAKGLSDTDIAEIVAEKNSYAKQELLVTKVEALIASKNTTPADKVALQNEITRLNGEFVKKENEAKAAIKLAEQKAHDEGTDYMIDSFLASQKYANEDLDMDTNILTAKTILTKELADKKAKIQRTGKDIKLINAENPDLDYLENNKAVKFSDLATSLLANKKLLKVNGQTPAPKPVVKTPTRNAGDVVERDASKLIGELDSSIAALQAL